MHKCAQCGAEFEGNFCPECGAKREDTKICPGCGAECKDKVRFCPDCGYSFVKSVSASQTAQESAPVLQAESAPAATVPQTESAPAPEAATQSNTLKKIYGVMRLLPSVLIAALAALNLLFFLADVGTMSAMGESAGLGSVYKALGNGPDEIKAVITALLVADILTLLFSAVFLYFTFNRAERTKSAVIADKSVRLTDILAVCAALLCLVLFIIACVACGKISGLAGQSGGLFGMKSSPSAGVILALVFSLIAAIAIAACIAGRYVLAKKNPGWSEEENEALQAVIAKEDAQGAPAAAADDDLFADGDNSAELSPEQQMRTLRNIKVVTRHLNALAVLRKAVWLRFWSHSKYSDWKPEQLAEQRKALKNFLIAYSILGAIMLALVIVFEVEFYPRWVLVLDIAPQMKWLYGFINGFAWFFAFFFILPVLLCIGTYPPLIKLEKTFYGVKKPPVLMMAPRYDVSKIFITEEKVEQKEIVCRRPAPDFVYIGHFLLYIVIFATTFFVHAYAGRDFIFNSTKYVEKISLGDNKSEVCLAIGYADGKDISVNSSGSGSPKYEEYVSENFRSTYLKLKELGSELKYTSSYTKQSEILKEIEELENACAGTQYKYIRVDYTADTNAVSSVILTSQYAAMEDYNANYTVSKVELIPAEDYTVWQSGMKFEAKVWFIGGSYHYSYVYPTVTDSAISWTDSYFRVPVTCAVKVVS